MSELYSPTPQAIFFQQYEMARRDELIGILLSLFLGAIGVHHFYLRRTALGILYVVLFVLLFWTGIPFLLGLIECFFMPARVREYNAMLAAGIAAGLGIAVPGWGAPAPVRPTESATTLTACPGCGRTASAGARFCSGCGARVA